MSGNSTSLDLTQLRKALQQAALDAEYQIARLKGFAVADEIADDLGNQILWILKSSNRNLTSEQVAALSELDAALDQMRGQQVPQLWTEEALRSRPEWDELRRKARNAIGLFGWPLNDVEIEPDEGAMLTQALRIAALPADQQLASFPIGSPVAAWIAGDFLNWAGLTLSRADFPLTDEQRFAIKALESRLNAMSDTHRQDPELWTNAGLQHRSEWEAVRKDARKILGMWK
ncbi:MAG: hypothetical protein SFU86_13675 [Pirellulaceae bacterium]|nr:hypothetical protein [Pirellulaceae bacterium]